MAEQILLKDIFYFFLCTAITVPVFKWAGLSGVLAYIFSGVLLGPNMLALFNNPQEIQDISQLGILILLFVIGLELSPTRLAHLKKTIARDGLLQFVLTSLIFAAAMVALGFNWDQSLLVGSALSLSSTAFGLTWLKDSGNLTKSYGQSSLGILIFQDLIIIPLVALVPLISSTQSDGQLSFSVIGAKCAMFMGALIFTRFLLVPWLDKCHQTQGKDVFIASCLVVVLGSALLMDQLGLSKALGSFAIGIILSSSKLKNEIQSFSLPLKSMLMGVFFLALGLSIDLVFVSENFAMIMALTFSILAIKGVVLTVLGRLLHKNTTLGIKQALILSQGGEFGLILLFSMVSHQLLDKTIYDYLFNSIVMTILFSSFLIKVIGFMESRPKDEVEEEIEAAVQELDNVVALKSLKSDEEQEQNAA